MTIEQAKIIATPHLGKPGAVVVTSDGGVFIGNPIKQMQEYADANKMQLFIIRDDKPEKPKKEK